jgi:hypothetical protein
MKATVLYRTASVLLFVVSVGTTLAFLHGWHVAASMAPVPFPSGHTGFSYAQVVLGLGLFCSLWILFGAYLAWHLGALARTAPRTIGVLGWLLFVYQLVGFYLSTIFCSAPPQILLAAISICVGWASWLTTTRRVTEQGI